MRDFMDSKYPDKREDSSLEKVQSFFRLFHNHLPKGVTPRLAWVYVPNGRPESIWRTVAIVIASNKTAEDRALGEKPDDLVREIQKTFGTTNAAGWYFPSPSNPT